ncbi:hypothetical protein JOV02_004280 [Salmonella enterica]|nr:hypothetical protein [Salmonella enterica]
MKKTLIALALAATTVSGSAMAWTANGTGGSVELGGTLTPQDVVTPWEVQTGAAVTGLNVSIKKGQNTVDVPVNKAIPVLGIRTQTSTPFQGQPGVSPHVNYGGALNTSDISGSEGTLSLEVKDSANNKIGVMKAPILLAAQMTRKGVPGTSLSYVDDNRNLYASSTDSLFYGGVGVNAASIAPDALSRIAAVIPEVADNLVVQGKEVEIGETLLASNKDITYSGYYGSGIESGKKIKITLDTPAQGNDAIAWKASFPVTVSYQ